MAVLTGNQLASGHPEPSSLRVGSGLLRVLSVRGTLITSLPVATMAFCISADAPCVVGVTGGARAGQSVPLGQTQANRWGRRRQQPRVERLPTVAIQKDGSSGGRISANGGDGFPRLKQKPDHGRAEQEQIKVQRAS